MTDQPTSSAAATSLAAALAALQAQIPVITKGETAEVETQSGRKYSYTYANLASIHAVVLPLLAAAGFAWACLPMLVDGQFVLSYSLMFAPTGEVLAGTYPLPTSGTPQAIGSAITYARRYTLTAVLAIAPDDDDDGQAAQNDAGAWHAPANPRTRKAVRSKGELGDDEWTTEPAPDADEPGSMTDAQGKRLKYLFGRKGIANPDSRLTYTKGVLGPLTSTDLSMADADRLIKHLEEDKR